MVKFVKYENLSDENYVANIQTNPGCTTEDIADHIKPIIRRKRDIRLQSWSIFWNFTIFQYRYDSPQVKRNFIYSIANVVYELPHEFPNDLRLRKLGNITKIPNLGGDKAQCPVSLQEIWLWQQQSKMRQKWISNFSFPVQYYWICLSRSKYISPQISSR